VLYFSIQLLYDKELCLIMSCSCYRVTGT
jgi:hypothetical protein